MDVVRVWLSHSEARKAREAEIAEDVSNSNASERQVHRKILISREYFCT